MFSRDADMAVDTAVAISWVHAGHGTEFVSEPLLLPLFDVHPTVHLSFPVSDIERTLDAMSWIHVRLCLSSIIARRDGWVTICVAQYVPLAYRRQPELPAGRAQFPGHCTKGRVQRRFSIHSAGRRPHRVLRRRSAFSSFHTRHHLTLPNYSTARY